MSGTYSTHGRDERCGQSVLSEIWREEVTGRRWENNNITDRNGIVSGCMPWTNLSENRRLLWMRQ
jgi:hypothetical protein